MWRGKPHYTAQDTMLQASCYYHQAEIPPA
jgi:hypothetical protein